MSKLTEKLIRNTLGALLFILAVNAFGGGYYGMAGAPNVPTEWLKDSLFRTYFVPGLFLFFCVGGSAFGAALLVFRQNKIARKAVFICVLIVLVWLIVQVAIIGYVSWLQPTIATVSILILLLNWKLPKY